MRKREEYRGYYVYAIVDIDRSAKTVGAFDATLTIQIARPIDNGRGVKPLYSMSCKTGVAYVERQGKNHVDSNSRLRVLELGVAFGKILVDFLLDMFEKISSGWIGGDSC